MGNSPQIPAGKETIQSLAARIKAKYPVYADRPDADLVKRVLDRYPQYQKALSTEELKRVAGGSVPSLWQEAKGVLSTAGEAAAKFYPQVVESTAAMLRQASPTGLSGAETARNIATPSGVTQSIAEAPAKSLAGKIALGAIPGTRTALSAADLAKRAAGGKPFTGESISQLQKDVASGAGQLAIAARAPEIERLGARGFRGKTPEVHFNRGVKDIIDSLDTPAGKGGRKAASVARDARTAASDIEQADLNIDKGVKGSEYLHDLAENLDKQQEEIWQKGHEPGIERHGDMVRKTARLKKAASKPLGIVAQWANPTEVKAARSFLDGIPDEMTLRQEDEFVRELNNDVRGKDPGAVGGYGPKGIAIRFNLLRELRADIDRALESQGEKGIKDYNRRWGAIESVKERIQQMAVRESRAEFKKNKLSRFPDWMHVYSFYHGGAVPFIGAALNPSKFFTRVPSDILQRGIESVRKSGIKPAPYFEPSSADYYRWSGIGKTSLPALPPVGQTGFRTVIGPRGEPITTDLRVTPTPEEFREQMISRGRLSPRALPEQAGGPHILPPSSSVETYPPAERVSGRYAGMLDQRVSRVGPGGQELSAPPRPAASPVGISGEIPSTGMSLPMRIINGDPHLSRLMVRVLEDPQSASGKAAYREIQMELRRRGALPPIPKPRSVK